MAKIKHTDHTTCGKHVEELELSKTLGKNKNGTITLKNNLRSKKAEETEKSAIFLRFVRDYEVTVQTTTLNKEERGRYTVTIYGSRNPLSEISTGISAWVEKYKL